MYDIAIIGTGVIGTTIARELSRYNLKIIMIDKSSDIAAGTTKANSAIVHAGYDAEYGTYKAQYNVQGNAMYPALCRELNVPFRQTGSLVCAFDNEQAEHLVKLKENGDRLGVPGLRIIDGRDARKREPNLSPKVKSALLAPTAGITEPWELAIGAAENAMMNGAELRLNYKVDSIKYTGSAFYIASGSNETISSRTVINCAGLHSDSIASMVTGEAEFSITPRRGQYCLLDKSAGNLVSSVIFPAPTKLGKGILITPTVDGNILVGPTAEDLDQSEKEAVETTSEGLSEVRKQAGRLIEKIPFHQTITVFSGNRAESSNGDFIIGESSVTGFFNAAGIKSPGLSAAPAIAVDMAQQVVRHLAPVEKNPEFNPVRRPRPKTEQMSEEELSHLIKLDPRFGNIICRCEMISEGEIMDAIHRRAGAVTVNGIKRRVRPGAGRCQGGFCGPRVMAILARELGRDINDITQEGPESAVLTGSTR